MRLRCWWDELRWGGLATWWGPQSTGWQCPQSLPSYRSPWTPCSRAWTSSCRCWSHRGWNSWRDHWEDGPFCTLFRLILLLSDWVINDAAWTLALFTDRTLLLASPRCHHDSSISPIKCPNVGKMFQLGIVVVTGRMWCEEGRICDLVWQVS